MQQPEELVARFYDAFGQLDYAGMNSLYDSNIIFADPVFLVLEGDAVKDMWEMLCTHAKDFSLTYEPVNKLDEEYFTCRWTASYTFSKTGRKVINKVTANMRIRDGKIIEHSDAFSIHRWAAQALGWRGWLFGGIVFFQRKVRSQARLNLEQYRAKKYNR